MTSAEILKHFVCFNHWNLKESLNWRLFPVRCLVIYGINDEAEVSFWERKRKGNECDLEIDEYETVGVITDKRGVRRKQEAGHAEFYVIERLTSIISNVDNQPEEKKRRGKESKREKKLSKAKWDLELAKLGDLKLSDKQQTEIASEDKLAKAERKLQDFKKTVKVNTINIRIYINASPCNVPFKINNEEQTKPPCAVRLIKFKKDMKDYGWDVNLTIISSSLYNIEQLENIAGLKNLNNADITLEIFNKEKWEMLESALQLKNENNESSLKVEQERRKAEREDEDKKWKKRLDELLAQQQ